MPLPLRVLHLEQSEKDAVQVLTALKKGGMDPVYKLIQTRRALIAELDNAWDVVLSETNLTQISVFEALQIVRDRGLQLPFFVISDSVGEEMAAALIKAGASDFVKKDKLAYLVPSIKKGLIEAAYRKEQRRTSPRGSFRANPARPAPIQNTADQKGLEALKDIYHQRLEMVNQLAIELAALPQDADFTAFIAVKLKQITGAFVVSITEYSKEERLLKPKYITIDSKMLQKFNSLLKKSLLETSYSVDEKTFQWITRSVVTVTGNLSELTFSAIPETVARVFNTMPGVNSFAELGFVYQDELMGTATLVLNKDLPLPPNELLYPLSNIIAVSWRRKKAEEALREAHQFSREVIKDVDGGIIVCDLDLHVQLWNPFMEKLTGIPAAAALGKKASGVFPPMWEKDPAQILELIQVGETVTTPTLSYHAPLTGKLGWISVTFSPRRSASGSMVGIIAMVQEITRLKEMDNEITRQAARAEALVHAAARLNAQLDLKTLLRTICEETIQALGVSAVVILLYDETTRVLRYASDIGIPIEVERQQLCMPVAALENYHFLASDQAYLSNFHGVIDPQHDTVFTGINAHTSASALIRRDDQLVGALTLFTFDQEHSFSSDEQDLFRGLADQAAQAIVNARLFENTQLHLQQVRALHDIDLAITSNANRGVSLDVILTHVTDQLGVDAASILLLNSRTQILEFAAGHGFRTDALKYTRLELGESYAGRAALDGKPIRVPDLRTSEAFFPSPIFAVEGFISYHNTPLIAKGHVIGVLEIYNRTRLDPNASWLEFYEALSTQAAIAIDNISLFDNLQQSNVELAQAYDTTLEGWSRALELRDKETQGHTRRVAEMTGYLAQKMGLSESELVQIRRGALLHDIGKMAIPDSILLKNGPLSPEEWLVMQKHPVYAYDLLSPIAYLRAALEIPYCHHEKWDGSGYPRRLKSEEIPLGARIFTIVDVWDALISDRPYRPAWTEEKALDYIKGQVGKHFDPQVASMFISMIEQKQFGPKTNFNGISFVMIDNDYPLLTETKRED